MILLAVLLPVPLAAATGLSIPLPATVERLAAQLVPFADPAYLGGTQPFAAGARGRIVETEDEVTLNKLLSADPTAQSVNEIAVTQPEPRAGSKSRNGQVKKKRNKPPGSDHSTNPKREPKAPKAKYKPPKPPPPPKASKVEPAGQDRKIR